jgi:hypothetical protein
MRWNVEEDIRRQRFEPLFEDFGGYGGGGGGGGTFTDDTSSKEVMEKIPECRVYLYYFPGHFVNEELIQALRKWGEGSGRNLFIGLWSQKDKDYQSLSKSFDLKNLPSIVMTGGKSIGAINQGGKWESAYLKLDDRRLLSNTSLITSCLERAFNLFLQNHIRDALKEKGRGNRAAAVKHYLGKVEGIGDFLNNHGVKVGVSPTSVWIESTPDTKIT